MWLAAALGIALALLKVCSASDDSAEVTFGQSESKSVQFRRTCSVQELLPLPCEGKSSEWANGYVTEQLYDCRCAAMKAR